MLFIDDLEKMIMLVILSQELKEKRPVNLMFVAKSESGGSTMMKQFDNIETVYFTSDITYSGIVKLLKDEIASGQIKVLMMSDYNKVLCRPPVTKMNFETVLNQILEEGVKNINLPNEMKLMLKDYVSISFITKVTTDMYNKYMLTWYETGFIQRFLIIKYGYSEKEISAILKAITENIQFNNIKYKIPKLKNIRITCKKEYNKRLVSISKQITMTYGFRIQAQLQLLLKAQTLFRYLDNKLVKDIKNINIKVTENDLKEIIRLSDYLYKPHTTMKKVEKKTNLLQKWRQRIKK